MPVEDRLRTRQFITLISSLLLALSAGTNYAFSIYSLQLGQRLNLSATAINIIGIAGNWGMYISSPFVGQLVDRYNPTVPLLPALTLVSLGYGSLWFIFSHSDLPILNGFAILGNLFVGIGSSIANSCAVTGIACVIEPSHRATAIGTVLAGFGLSAFFWTTLGSFIAQSNTAVLLILLSIGPALAIFLGTLGYFLVGLDESSDSRNNQHQSNQSQRLMDHHESESTQLLPSKLKIVTSGWELVKEGDFWMIWMVMSCCCGIALMIINNIGTMVAALSQSDPTSEIQLINRGPQAKAVSTLSIFNCLGRVFAGTISDLFKKHLRIGRVWWLSWVSLLFLGSQLLGYYIVEDLNQLVWLAGLVGFSYGNLYGIAPALILEWFGLESFATNFGYLNLSPLLSGQIFNLSFGKIFDSHSHRRINDSNDEARLICDDGKKCYQAAFLITTIGSLISLCLSICLAYRRPEFTTTETHKKARGIHTDDENEASMPILTAQAD